MATSPRELILVTGLSLGAACSGSPKVEGNADPFISMNPPEQRFEKRTSPVGQTDRTAPGSAKDRLLNPVLPGDGRTIFASDNGGCHIYERLAEPAFVGARGGRIAVACPESMLKPEWGHCTYDSTMYINNAGDACTCAPSGNPPPPTYGVACPS